MGNTRTYDTIEVNVIIGGTVITGYAEGSFVTASRAEDSFTEYVGAKGEVALAESNNKTGEITITLENTSPSVPYLYELSNRKGKNAIVDVSVVDANDMGKIRIGGAEARVRKPADYEAGKEITEREFVLFVSQLDFVL